MVIWICGLSGSGKTTIGHLTTKLWKRLAPNTVMVDGDDVRRLIGHDDSPERYTLEGRHKVAMRISAVCKWLDDQDINVVCSTISLFEDIHQINREQLSGYFEVYLNVPMDILVCRDNKNLYDRALRGEISNVVGVDIKFTPPAAANLTIDNSTDHADLEPVARRILEAAGIFSVNPAV